MGDCRLCSLVLCHDHSAQILEFFTGVSLASLVDVLARERENPVQPKSLRPLFIVWPRRQFSASVQSGDDERFSKDSHKPMRDSVNQM
jgi:hypothetical protein